MLQVLAGILEPSVGKVEVRGKIATLLQLGAGFDPELNARENTLLVGEFLGILTRRWSDAYQQSLNLLGSENLPMRRCEHTVQECALDLDSALQPRLSPTSYSLMRFSQLAMRPSLKSHGVA